MAEPRASSRTFRLACLMLVLTLACALSGILMDVRVMGLLARAGTIQQAELERADEIATLLLLITLIVSVACVLAIGAWVVRVRPRARIALFLALAALAVPAANPVAPFLVRGFENSLPYSIAARALGMAGAMAALVLIRRTSRRRVGPGPA